MGEPRIRVSAILRWQASILLCRHEKNGREHWFKGVGLPIFWWRFEDGGRRVAYGQSTVHSSCGTNYELRDVRSEQLVDAVLVPEEESSGCPPWPPGTKPTRIPDWVKRLSLTRGR